MNEMKKADVECGLSVSVLESKCTCVFVSECGWVSFYLCVCVFVSVLVSGEFCQFSLFS